MQRDKPEPPLLGLATRNYFVNYEKQYRRLLQRMERALETMKNKMEAYQATYEIFDRIRRARILQKVILMVKYFLKK